MIGRRRPDTRLDRLPRGELHAGDYWKVLDPETGTPRRSDDPTNLTGTVWMVVAPLGDGFAIGRLEHHTVREHDDGTISVRAGDGSSNSILISRGTKSWHGYIEHGVWSACS